MTNRYIKTAPTKRVCSTCLTGFTRANQSTQNRFQCKGCDTAKRTTLFTRALKITNCITQSLIRKI